MLPPLFNPVQIFFTSADKDLLPPIRMEFFLDSYGFLRIPMDFYGFLCIQLMQILHVYLSMCININYKPYVDHIIYEIQHSYMLRIYIYIFTLCTRTDSGPAAPLASLPTNLLEVPGPQKHTFENLGSNTTPGTLSWNANRIPIYREAREGQPHPLAKTIGNHEGTNNIPCKCYR
jgi:hypothetical protein